MSPVSHKGQRKLIWTEANIWPWSKSKELTFCRPQAKAQHLIFRREIYSLSRCPSPCPLVIPIPVTQHTCSSQWSTQICCPFSRAGKRVQANQSNVYVQTLIQEQYDSLENWLLGRQCTDTIPWCHAVMSLSFIPFPKGITASVCMPHCMEQHLSTTSACKA